MESQNQLNILQAKKAGKLIIKRKRKKRGGKK